MVPLPNLISHKIYIQIKITRLWVKIRFVKPSDVSVPGRPFRMPVKVLQIYDKNKTNLIINSVQQILC